MVGNIIIIMNAILSTLARSFIPTTSPHTGTTEDQYVPQTAVAMMAKKQTAPKSFANIQMNKQNTPHNAVIAEAILIRPILSLTHPTRDLPIPWPKLRMAPTTAPCCDDNPSVVGHRIVQYNISELTKESPSQDHQDRGSAKQPIIEGQLVRFGD